MFIVWMIRKDTTAHALWRVLAERLWLTARAVLLRSCGCVPCVDDPVQALTVGHAFLGLGACGPNLAILSVGELTSRSLGLARPSALHYTMRRR